MLEALTAVARLSYEAYVEHVKACRQCWPSRCVVAEELCRTYLDKVRPR
ncbi:MAG: hypothetical protein HOZ81_38155 [Streptomyces sp.]|nr:hypothetical protein [Streptomyces sp.]NUS14773.1 hypothetical protein [Streptomyces sp.]